MRYIDYFYLRYYHTPSPFPGMNFQIFSTSDLFYYFNQLQHDETLIFTFMAIDCDA
jgi:hypothetical protein